MPLWYNSKGKGKRIIRVVNHSWIDVFGTIEFEGDLLPENYDLGHFLDLTSHENICITKEKFRKNQLKDEFSYKLQPAGTFFMNKNSASKITINLECNRIFLFVRTVIIQILNIIRYIVGIHQVACTCTNNYFTFGV